MTAATVRARLTAFVRELRDAYPLWLFLAGLGVASVGGWWWGHDQPLPNGIRYAGTILTVFGLLLVAHGLDETRSVFGKPTLTSRAFAWGKRVVASVRRRNIAIGVGTAHIALSGVAASGHVEALLSDASVEGRIAHLERQLQRFREQAEADRKALREEIAAVRSSVDAETARTSERMSGIEGRLDALAVGGLVLEWIGLWWLLLGAVAANMSGELATLWILLA